jgi:hypothetical protein
MTYSLRWCKIDPTNPTSPYDSISQTSNCYKVPSWRRRRQVHIRDVKTR